MSPRGHTRKYIFVCALFLNADEHHDDDEDEDSENVANEGGQDECRGKVEKVGEDDGTIVKVTTTYYGKRGSQMV